ncbi:MAG: outer membrane protein [Candidatus Azotimanducaceae bacterium]|jgi:outer membrane protein
MRNLLIICFAFLSVHVYAQKEWTLQEAVTYALENNISVKQSDLNALSSEETYNQSKLGQLPSLNGSIAQGYNFGRSVDPFTNQFTTQRIRNNNFSLFSSVTLFNGLQARNNIKKNYFELLAVKFDADKMKNDISLNVASSYLQLLFNRELLKVAQQQIELTAVQLERIKELVNAGSLPKGSLLDIQAQYASEERQLVSAENALELSRLSMGMLLMMDDPKNFRAASIDTEMNSTVLLENTPGEIYGIAVLNQPSIKSANYRVLSSEKALAAAKGGLSPRITLNGSVGTGYSDGRKELDKITLNGTSVIGYTSGGDSVYVPDYSQTFKTTSFQDQVNDNFSQSISVSLNIPIFNGGQVRRNIRQSKIQVLNSQYNLEQQENTLRQNIEQAYTDAKSALKSYVAAEKSLDANQLAFDYAEQRYELGMINAYEYKDSKNRLIRASSDLLQAKYDFVFKVKILEFYKSSTLTF